MLNLSNYYAEYESVLRPNWLFDRLHDVKDLIIATNKQGGKIIFAGNGASSAIASHAALDFTKQAGINSITFHDPALITAYVNDYGSDRWLAEAFRSHVGFNDLVVFISVSGESPNVVTAAEELIARNVRSVSFTGRSSATTLAKKTDINLWVASHAYNVVECIHMIWVTTIIDMIIGKSVYSVN